MDKQEYNKGYQAALEAIKQAKQQQGGGGGGPQQDNGLEGIPQDPSDQQDGEGSGKGNKKDKKQQSGNGSGSGKSRDSKESDNVGVVRPEDCTDPTGQLSNQPGQVGGMIDRSMGDQIVEQEGYEKEGGNDSALEREWSKAAKEASKQMGNSPGAKVFQSKVDDLYNSSKNWKKELEKIVGRSISYDDKRQAYANKNVLISQDRIARTDKDKYDSMDYMMCWIDTSGSMSQDYLDQCIRDLYAIALTKKPLKIVIVQFDTKITDVQEFRNLAELKKNMKLGIKLKGGGGTDIKDCFNMITNRKEKYAKQPADLVVIFTDGYLKQYKRPKRNLKNLCWVVIGNPQFELEQPDSGTKLVKISEKDFNM